MDTYIHRVIDIQSRLKNKSLFLFGPRQTGKSSLIANQIQDDVRLSWTLLNARIRRRCQTDPGVLRDEIETKGIKDGLVIIDEIQKVPELLDEVHSLIEETDIRFLLTGSSARRLKEKCVNLLGGRAGKMSLHPFVWPEIRGFEPALDRILMYGLIPSAFLSDEPESVLDDYVNVYLKDEIAGEGLVRQLPKFERFLEVAAMTAESGYEVLWDNVTVDFNSIEIDGDRASVDCYCTVQYISSIVGDALSGAGCRYWIELREADGTWLLTDLSTPPRNY